MAYTIGGVKGPTGRMSPEVELLLNAAEMHGGSLAEVAAELSHPGRSIRATASEFIKNTFAGTMKVINTPLNLMAGAMSSEYTMGEAMKENLMPSEVLFGDEYETENPVARGLDWIGRNATDILLDPLTYMTFGTGRVAIIGTSALSKIKLGEKAAAKIGKTAGELAMVSKEGDSLLTKMTKYFNNPSEVKLNEVEELVVRDLKDERSEAIKRTFLEEREEEIIDEFAMAGKIVDNDEVEKRLLKLANDVPVEDMEKQILAGKLNPDFAKRAVSRIMEYNPDLARTVLDRGGIKVFNKTILSGQRIKATANIIPGMSTLDKLTQPARKVVGRMFDKSWTSAGKAQEAAVNTIKKYDNLFKSLSAKQMDSYVNMARSLDLTENEWDLILAAKEASIRPADAQSAAVWDVFQGIKPDAGILKEDIITAAGFIDNKYKQSIRDLRRSGVQVTEMKHYVRHFVKDSVKQNVKNSKRAFGVDKQIRATYDAFDGVGNSAGARIFGKSFLEETTENGTFIRLMDNEGNELARLKKYENVDNIQESKWLDELNGEEYKRVRITIPEARSLGVDFETNLLAVTLRSSLDATRTAISTNMTRDFARSFGQLASEAPADWRPINFSEFNLDSKKVNFDDFLTAKNGESMVFHPANAEYFEKMYKAVLDDEVEDIMRNYDKIQNFTKASLTSIWPMFHGRNAISNVFLNYLNLGFQSLSPAVNVGAMNMQKKNWEYTKLMEVFEKGITAPEGSAKWTKAMKARDDMTAMNAQKLFTDRNGYDWSFGELHKLIKNDVVAFNPGVVGQIDIDKTFQENLETTLAKAKAPKGIKARAKENLQGFITLDADRVAPFKLGKDIGSAVEDHARLVSFFGNLKKTGDVELSAARTREFLFDYSNISTFERKVMRRVMPFYTFFRKNMELQVKTLLKEPGKIAAEMRSISTLGEAISGGELSAEDQAMLPEWLQKGVVVQKSRQGKDIEIFTGVQTPTEAMFQQSTPEGLIGMISPLIKYPVEMATGYSFFRGREISELTKADAFRDAPGWIKDYIGFTEVPLTRSDGTKILDSSGKPMVRYQSLRPERMYNLMNFPLTSRAMSVLGKAEDADATLDDKIIYAITGVGSAEFNLDVEAANREEELAEQLRQKLQTAGLGYTFKRFNLKD